MLSLQVKLMKLWSKNWIVKKTFPTNWKFSIIKYRQANTL